MKAAVIAASCALVFLAAAFGPRWFGKPAPAAVEQAAAQAEWKPSLVEDGYMFPDQADFRDYLESSEIVAIGTLTAWNGLDGTLRVDRVLRGRAGAELSLRAGGGAVRPAVGERVVALLSKRDGKMTLHSLCAAGGLYHLNKPLVAYLDSALHRR
jgi:hypothetical protein